MSFVAGAVTAGVGAIIFLLIERGFKKVEAKTQGDTTIISGLDQNGKPFSVKLNNEAINGAQYDIVTLSTGATTITKPDRPQYFVENEQDTDKRVFAIAFAPDAGFKTAGIIEIFLNRVRLFPITDPVQGFLTNVTSLNIPIPPNFGLKIKPRQKLEVFVYNPSGANVTVNFAVFVGDFA